MNRIFALCGALAVGVLVSGSAVGAGDKDLPDIGEIMQKAHGKEGYRASITGAVKKANWDDAAKTIKDWQKLGDALAKGKPEKGSAASWKKHTANYNKALKSIAAAIDKKNATTATGILGDGLKKQCTACHMAHRE
jgi:hypothetical protein